jgi:hypothetical protein
MPEFWKPEKRVASPILPQVKFVRPSLEFEVSRSAGVFKVPVKFKMPELATPEEASQQRDVVPPQRVCWLPEGVSALRKSRRWFQLFSQRRWQRFCRCVRPS